MIRQEQKIKNSRILPIGEYKVVEIPNGRRTFVVVEKSDSSDRYRFFFKRYMGWHYSLRIILQSDGEGNIKVTKTAKEQENRSGFTENNPIKLLEFPSGTYLVVEELKGKRTSVIMMEFGNNCIMYQISFNSFRKSHFVLGNVLQINGTGGVRVLE